MIRYWWFCGPVMVVVCMTAVVMVEVVIMSNLIYIVLGGFMCLVFSCDGVNVGFSIFYLTKAVISAANTTTP